MNLVRLKNHLKIMTKNTFRRKNIFICFIVLVTGFMMAACKNPTFETPSVSISISPTVVDVVQGDSQQFTATIKNTSNEDVLWKIERADGGQLKSDTTIGYRDGLLKVSVTEELGKITVKATMAANNSKTSTAVVNVLLLGTLTGSVEITGDNWVGSTLNVDVSKLNGMGDISYQWKLDGTAITGETNSTYVIREEDADGEITVSVGRKENTGTITSDPVTVIWPPLGGQAEITSNGESGGEYRIGNVLTVDTDGITGAWEGGVYSYQWQVGGSPIQNAENSSYTVRSADAGKIITCIVKSDKGTGSVTATGLSVPFELMANITDTETGDEFTISPEFGNAGEKITLTFSIFNDPSKKNNQLELSGPAAFDQLANFTVSGEYEYTISPADAVAGVITIKAKFIHTSKGVIRINFVHPNPADITYDDDNGNKFTNLIVDSPAGCVVTYSITSAGGIAMVDPDTGVVTIQKAGSVTIRADMAENAEYYSADADYTLVINPKQLFWANRATVDDKTYDGTTDATFYNPVTLSGIVGTDDVIVVPGTAHFVSSDAGQGEYPSVNVVMAVPFSITGADTGNYILPADLPFVDNFAAIYPRPVTITVSSVQNKVYDGKLNATPNETSISPNPAFPGDTFVFPSADIVSVITGSASFDDKDVGTNKVVRFSGYDFNALKKENYILTPQPANVTADITKRPITISGVSATSRTYEPGNTTVELTGGILQSIIQDDDIDFTLGSGMIASANAGTVQVTTNIQLTGADMGNYNLSKPSVTVTIIKADGAVILSNMLWVTAKTHNSIYINQISSPRPITGQVVEYAISDPDGVPPDAPGEWKENVWEFKGLKEDTDYYIFARAKEDPNYVAGNVVSIKTKTEVASIGNKIVFFWEDDHDFDGLINIHDVQDGYPIVGESYVLNRPNGELTITAEGFSNHVWLINNLEDEDFRGEKDFTFYSAGREQGKNYIITLRGNYNGDSYNVNFIVRVE